MPPCSHNHWLPESTDAALVEKVPGVLVEAMLLPAEAEKGRQRKDNKRGKKQIKREHSDQVFVV